MGLLLGREEAQRQTAVAGAPGAADAMHVVHRRARQIEVHHHRQLVDMDTAGGQVGGHDHVPTFVLEFLQGLLAGALAQATVQRGGVHIALVQLAGQVVGHVLGVKGGCIGSCLGSHLFLQASAPGNEEMVCTAAPPCLTILGD